MNTNFEVIIFSKFIADAYEYLRLSKKNSKGKQKYKGKTFNGMITIISSSYWSDSGRLGMVRALKKDLFEYMNIKYDDKNYWDFLVVKKVNKNSTKADSSQETKIRLYGELYRYVLQQLAEVLGNSNNFYLLNYSGSKKDFSKGIDEFNIGYPKLRISKEELEEIWVEISA